MSSQTRLNASSDKYWLQKIADNTELGIGDVNIQKLAPSPNQSKLQSVGIFGDNGSSEWKAISVDATGKIDIQTTGLATETKQDDQITLATTLNGKISKGEDDTLTEAQQVCIYGRKDETPTGLRALKVLNNGSLNTNDATLNGKISKGDTSIVAGSGGLQQNLVYGKDPSTGVLYPVATQSNGWVYNSISAIPTTDAIMIAGEDSGGSKVPVGVGTNGNLRTHEQLERSNSIQTFFIPTGTTQKSATVNMSNYQYLAIFGTTDNTFNKNITIEYSHDDVNWYAGSEENSKVVIVNTTGEFYEQNRIITRYVRISRPNGSGSTETITINFTRA